MTRFGKKLLALVLAAVLAAGSCGPLAGRYAVAAGGETTYSTPKTGTAACPTENAINVRQDANSATALVETIPNGQSFEIIGEKSGTTGKKWYRIRFATSAGTKEGYAFAEYVFVEGSGQAPLETYDTPKLGYVDYAPAANMRSGPSSASPMVKDKNGNNVQLISGTKVEVLAKASPANTGAYYKCNVMVDGVKKEGYLYADFVRIYQTPSGDEEFVKQLITQGFPDSYIEPLRILHAQHPKWVFTADKLNLDWSTALAAESAYQMSLVNYVSPTSWKSLDPKAYNYNVNNVDGGWKKLDGYHWEAANEVAVAYFMDPRNFLTEAELFQFEIQSYDASVHTLERVQALLQDTFMAGNIPNEYKWDSQTILRDEKGNVKEIQTVERSSGTPLTYAEVFLESAKISGVSPDMLVARVIQEMGTAGNSQIISGNSNTAPGHYNYYDFGTYATSDMDAITRGLKYAKGDYVKKESWAANCLPWNTRWKSLYGGAIMLGRDYINRGQDTLYYQKFNVNPGNNGYALYSHQYMTNIQAPSNEARTMWQACPNLDTVISFKIPVYKNMPENPMPYPKGDSTANPNAYLKTVGVTYGGTALDIPFAYNKLEYGKFTVPESTSQVTVTAAALAGTTKISGTGNNIALSYGDNAIKVTSTAAFGNSVTYTINIFREGGSGNNGGSQGGNVTEHLETGYIPDGKMLYGIEPGTSVEQLLKNITVQEGGTVSVVNAKGEALTSGNIGTGCVVKTPQQEFTVVIYGDTDGDGEISTFDLIDVKRALLGLAPLDGIAIMAANVDPDNIDPNNVIDTYDLIAMKRHLLSLGKIEQPKK